VFVTLSLFHGSQIFVGKTGANQSGVLRDTTANVCSKPCSQILELTNTLAYYCTGIIAALKALLNMATEKSPIYVQIVSAPSALRNLGVNVTELLFFITPFVAKHSGTNLVIKTADRETNSITLFINLIETYDGSLSYDPLRIIHNIQMDKFLVLYYSLYYTLQRVM
jgi:hypothetical protein